MRQPLLAGNDAVMKLPDFDVVEGLPGGSPAGTVRSGELIAGAGQEGEAPGDGPGPRRVPPFLYGDSAPEVGVHSLDVQGVHEGMPRQINVVLEPLNNGAVQVHA